MGNIFREDVHEGFTIPLPYAPAFMDVYRNRLVCYVFPFNLLVRYVRSVWYWMNEIEGSHRYIKDHPCYKMGYKEGESHR